RESHDAMERFGQCQSRTQMPVPIGQRQHHIAHSFLPVLKRTNRERVQVNVQPLDVEVAHPPVVRSLAGLGIFNSIISLGPVTVLVAQTRPKWIAPAPAESLVRALNGPGFCGSVRTDDTWRIAKLAACRRSLRLIAMRCEEDSAVRAAMNCRPWLRWLP